MTEDRKYPMIPKNPGVKKDINQDLIELDRKKDELRPSLSWKDALLRISELQEELKAKDAEIKMRVETIKRLCLDQQMQIDSRDATIKALGDALRKISENDCEPMPSRHGGFIYNEGYNSGSSNAKHWIARQAKEALSLIQDEKGKP